jgi:hypothetical protein
MSGRLLGPDPQTRDWYRFAVASHIIPYTLPFLQQFDRAFGNCLHV